MVRRATHTMPERLSEISMTPLIDLTFLLLITFVITFPLIEQGIPVNLPRAKAQDLISEKARTITVNQRGDIYLENTLLSLEQLKDRMAVLVNAEPDLTVMIRADESIRYGHLVTVLKVLHDVNVSKMALVTQAEEKPKT